MFSLSRLFHANRPAASPARHRPVVGLDIGSSAIKVAEIKRSGKQWQLLHCGMQPLAPDAVIDGHIKQPELVTQAIKEVLASSGITTQQTAISLSGTSVITKKIQMTRMTELDLEEQIALEAEEYIPFDIDDVHLDFQILSQQEESMEVLLTACKKEVIHNHTEVIRQAGLQPQVCDLDLFCLVNAYTAFVGPLEKTVSLQQPAERKTTLPKASARTHDQPMETVVLVNLGATFLNIAMVTSQGLPGYIRDHALGCRQLIQEIQSRYDLSWAAAEQRLIMPEQENPRHSASTDLRNEAINPFLEQVVQQIRQAISFHKTGTQEQPITAVCLSGGGALLANAAPFISEQLELPVQTATFANLTHPRSRGKPGSGSASLIQQMAPRFMVALGLALRGDMP
ncbi:MAG: type IV pilus assembly protein PilM [Magnetococcales bacterium]|nr:type IV pilus assembly protein PilM [Magnetococcales bacterium]